MQAFPSDSPVLAASCAALVHDTSDGGRQAARAAAAAGVSPGAAGAAGADAAHHST